ncbi:OmpH family outer membrane protein [Candidatus Dependentiae bacterium]|nr:OmpH family outer membrane protein [Candidatus Dependentiae bacterium]
MNRFITRYLLMSIACGCAHTEAVAPKVEKAGSSVHSEATTTKFAYVDLQKIITINQENLVHSADEWKELYSKIKSRIEPLNKEIMGLEEKYDKLKKDFETLHKGGLAKEEVLKTKYEELMRTENDLRRQYQEREQFSQDELAKAQGQIGPKIDKAINAVRARFGYDMIFHREALVSADSKLDRTKEVRDELNKQYNEEHKTAKQTTGKTAAPAA